MSAVILTNSVTSRSAPLALAHVILPVPPRTLFEYGKLSTGMVTASTTGWRRSPIGDDANRIAALKTRSIDGAIVNLAQALNFVQRGEGKVLLRFGDLVKDFHIHVIFATDKAIAAKPQALRGFLKGWLQTIAFMRKNRSETIDIAKDVMGTDAETAGGIYDELMPMFSDTGRFDPKALAVLRKSFVEMKTLPQEPDMSTLYTEAFLPTEGQMR